MSISVILLSQFSIRRNFPRRKHYKDQTLNVTCVQIYNIRITLYDAEYSADYLHLGTGNLLQPAERGCRIIF